MTEISDIKKNPFWVTRQPRNPRPVRFAIDPQAFVFALIGSPLLVALLGFWALLIPVVGIVLGGPVYLAFAIPVLLWDLPRREPTFWRLAGLGLAAHLVFLLIVALGAVLVPNLRVDGLDAQEILAVYSITGALMAPLWAGTFAPLYHRFRRARFAVPLA